MILFRIGVRYGEKTRVKKEQDRHQCGQALMLWPQQTEDPEKGQSADEPPQQGIQMPVDNRIPQQPIDEGIHNTHEWAIDCK